jgi:hypothetical protein
MGKSMQALTVFSLAIRYLKEHLQKSCKEQWKERYRTKTYILYWPYQLYGMIELNNLWGWRQNRYRVLMYITDSNNMNVDWPDCSHFCQNLCLDVVKYYIRYFKNYSQFWEMIGFISSNTKCIYFRHCSSRWIWFRILPLFLYNFCILLNLFLYSICTKITDRFNPASMLCLSEARTWISNVICRSLLYDQCFEVRDDYSSLCSVF